MGLEGIICVIGYRSIGLRQQRIEALPAVLEAGGVVHSLLEKFFDLLLARERGIARGTGAALVGADIDQAAIALAGGAQRSDERRVTLEGVVTCRKGWTQT